ncbi:membrane protein [Paenibacillus swuensis]|uniref:Membrane protein n=1 Tax=Paenibacillus swuensis TaxID=1178515 RepID=A0A172TDY3_9BACL|nr:DedA family protein [Paenibacillus swuensis]ANE45134.1 membrane protein [Paenibacillus swuensis]
MLHDLVSNLLLWVESLGAWGIMLGLMIEVIPSEIVLAFGGYLVAQGKVSFLGAVIFGTIGGVIAQIFVYWIGRYGGRPFLEKFGKYILINKKQIDMSEAWFEKYGTGVIFTARFIPVVRHAISVPAGIAKMPLGKFTFLTTLAVIPWSILFVYLGYTLGDQWEHVEEKAGAYITPILIVAVLLMAVFFLYKWRQSKRVQG